ncbi:MAG: choice-of-anchor A family protein [Phycisphaerales bacterium]|nr:choice-of-anchor A family protein [Phycisphaerales bacterium]
MKSFGTSASKAAVVVSTVASIALACSTASGAVNYWDFNVFSRSTIGTPGQGYGSDFQGASGAVGDVNFNGFTVKGVAGTSSSLARGFYGGGNFTLQGSVDHDGIEVAGNVTLNSGSVNGIVRAGGNLGGSSGSVNGNAVLGGQKTTGNPLTVSGSVIENQPFSPSVNLGAVSSYFANVGSYAANHAPTTNFSMNFSQMVINATGPLTVVNITAANLAGVWGIHVNGGGTVIVNLAGTNLSLTGLSWSYAGGSSAQKTLLNMNQATSISMQGSNEVNMLAANAAVNFSSGLVTGNLIVGSLTGSGQVNWNGGFEGGSDIPSAGGVSVLALAGLLASRRRR